MKIEIHTLSLSLSHSLSLSLSLSLSPFSSYSTQAYKSNHYLVWFSTTSWLKLQSQAVLIGQDTITI